MKNEKKQTIRMLKGMLLSFLLLLFLSENATAQLFQVLISEVMFKPSAHMPLPNAEYIELYNQTAAPIDLSNWKIGVGKTRKTLVSGLIAPHGYVIVAAVRDTALFSRFGPVVPVSSLSLENNSQTLFLYNGSDECVHSVTYHMEWLPDEKQAGGFSLEMKDVSNPCGERENWQASVALEGGTPGGCNSLVASVADTLAPHLIRAINEDSVHIRLFFSEKMLPSSLSDISIYTLDEGYSVREVVAVANDWKSVLLQLNKPLSYGKIYTVRLLRDACDCVGNAMGEGESQEVPDGVRFGRSEPADSFDVVINEVLFHPYSAGSDFVELFNRSDKILDLRNIRLSSQKSNGRIDTGKRVSEDGFQLLPHGYCCLSGNLSGVSAFYDGLGEDNGCEMSSFPAYANSSGRVVLLGNGRVLDDFTYAETMHDPLLVSTAGVSLEKMHPDLETQRVQHWHSASSSVGYATPGQPNSCYSSFEKPEGEPICVESSIFSPDGDGYQDVLKIHYHMPEASCRASAWIYHMQGQCVRRLLNNELLGVDGMVSWDGMMDNQLKAPLGAYLFLFEYWTLSGKVRRVKRVVTVAGR